MSMSFEIFEILLKYEPFLSIVSPLYFKADMQPAYYKMATSGNKIYRIELQIKICLIHTKGSLEKGLSHILVFTTKYILSAEQNFM